MTIFKMATVYSLIVACFLASLVGGNVFHMNNIVPDTLEDDGVHWALIVAGSNGWYNYRHQADACHAYQIISAHGIPDERIVVMMYDDLAHNSENPTPGIVINHLNGSDVYHGVPKDYTGEDVTPENFLKILQGKKSEMAGIGSGKVIASGPNDRVFVNFADHGAPGLIAFPDGELTSTQLMDAITAMHQNKQYKEMVFYIEACESGSMFENLLPDNINVYATTAANSEESSYACYLDEERGTYLGDVYSVNWMEDSDAEDLKSETLEKQFSIVKQETNTSHVMEFGDKTISNEHVAVFQGKATAVSKRVPQVPYDAVPSPDVVLSLLQHKSLHHQEKATRMEAAQEVQIMLQEREIMKAMLLDILSQSVGPQFNKLANYLMEMRLHLNDRVCYEAALQMFDQRCVKLSEHAYGLRLLFGLVNLCEIGVDIENIESAINNVCTPTLKQSLSMFSKY